MNIRIYVLSACMVFMMGWMPSFAQSTVMESGLTDQWSWGIMGGVYAPASHHEVLHDARPLLGMKLAKDITPVFGFSLEALTAFNSSAHVQGSSSKTMVDAMDVSLMANLNLSNLLGGYWGTSRPVEVEAVYGMGWGHLFYPKSTGNDVNMLVSRAGLELNIHLNTPRSILFHIRPAVVWALTGDEGQHVCRNTHYDINHASLEVTMGVTWRIRNSHNTYCFVKARLYDQSETDALNAKINDLRKVLQRKDQMIEDRDKTIDSLKHQIDSLTCQALDEDTDKEASTGSCLEPVVLFSSGSSDVEASQYINMERMIAYLKEHGNNCIVIKGYTSPEGSESTNDCLAKSWTEPVKNLLIRKYGVGEEWIQTVGPGVVNRFAEPERNRVAVLTRIE